VAAQGRGDGIAHRRDIACDGGETGYAGYGAALIGHAGELVDVAAQLSELAHYPAQQLGIKRRKAPGREPERPCGFRDALPGDVERGSAAEVGAAARAPERGAGSVDVGRLSRRQPEADDDVPLGRKLFVCCVLHGQAWITRDSDRKEVDCRMLLSVAVKHGNTKNIENLIDGRAMLAYLPEVRNGRTAAVV
jgi:hypothetical protein